MKCSKQSFAVVSVVFAVLLSWSTTLHARDADLLSHLRGGSDGQTAMHEYLPCTISRLPVLEANTIHGVPGCLPGLHPQHL